MKIVARSEQRQAWYDRHPNAVRNTLLGSWLAVAAAAGFFGEQLGEYQERSGNADNLVAAARHDRCAQVVRANTQPGSQTAIVRFASLSSQELADCGLDGLGGIVQDAIHTDFRGEFGSKITSIDLNPKVQLPALNRLEAVAASDRQDARTTGIGIPIELAFGGAVLGFLGAAFVTASAINSVDKFRTNPGASGPASV